MDGSPLPLAEGPVLLALDEPRHVAAALSVARALCARLDRSVTMIHAAVPALSTEGVLEHLELAPQDLAGIVLEPLEGAPEEVIPRFARERRSSVLLVGLNPGLLDPGPVARSLLLNAPCPVLLVPPTVRARWGEGGVVLLPLDGTPSTASVAPLAIEMAVRTSSKLEILYVGGALPPSEPGAMGFPSFIDQPQYEWAEWKREFLHRFFECHCGGERPVDVTLTLGKGSPGDAILDLAERHAPDLIVIGWHGELEHAHAKTLRTVLNRSRWPVMTARI